MFCQRTKSTHVELERLATRVSWNELENSGKILILSLVFYLEEVQCLNFCDFNIRNDLDSFGELIQNETGKL